MVNAYITIIPLKNVDYLGGNRLLPLDSKQVRIMVVTYEIERVIPTTTNYYFNSNVTAIRNELASCFAEQVTDDELPIVLFQIG